MSPLLDAALAAPDRHRELRSEPATPESSSLYLEVRVIAPSYWGATPEDIWKEKFGRVSLACLGGGNLLQHGPFISHFKNRELFPMFGKKSTFDL